MHDLPIRATSAWCRLPNLSPSPAPLLPSEMLLDAVGSVLEYATLPQDKASIIPSDSCGVLGVIAITDVSTAWLCLQSLRFCVEPV